MHKICCYTVMEAKLP